MKITKAQQEEIDFFTKDFNSTDKEKYDYIRETVYGEKTESNRISERKRGYDITIPMWRKDLVNGLLSIDELYNDEDFKKFPYYKKLIDSVLKSLNFNKYKSGEGFATIAFVNAMRKKELLDNPLSTPR